MRIRKVNKKGTDKWQYALGIINKQINKQTNSKNHETRITEHYISERGYCLASQAYIYTYAGISCTNIDVLQPDSATRPPSPLISCLFTNTGQNYMHAAAADSELSLSSLV